MKCLIGACGPVVIAMAAWRMRLHPKRWNEELWVCSMRGHETPAARTRVLTPGADDVLGLDVGHMRLARCLRCDSWIAGPIPTGTAIHHMLPPLHALPQPRRGHVLQEAITMKVIALWRGAHAVVFLLLAALLAIVRTNLIGWKQSAATLVGQVGQVVDQTGRTNNSGLVFRSLERLSVLNPHTVTLSLLTAIGYAAMEGSEAVGLWLEKKWAEYLTVITTALLLPLAVHELIKRVTVFRIFALVANIGVLVFLVWTKRLFGFRGGTKDVEVTDWTAVLALTPPTGR